MTGASGKKRHAPCGIDDTPKQNSTENLSSLARADLLWPRSVHRGRCHEASCKWDRMRRPRAGDARSSRSRAGPGLPPRPGGAGAPPGGTTTPCEELADSGPLRLARGSKDTAAQKGPASKEPKAERNGASESAARRRQEYGRSRATNRHRLLPDGEIHIS